MTNVCKSGLMANLRTAISADHDAIERTPFSIAMLNGSLSRLEYATNLVQMLAIHEKLEDLCESSSTLAPFFWQPMRRTEAITKDLAALDSAAVDSAALNSSGQIGNLLTSTREMVEQIQQWFDDSPISLIGCIYILEGSRMGSLVLAKPLASCLGISGQPGTGIDYHIDGARDVPQRLKEWKQIVEDQNFDQADADAISNCATQFMHLLNLMYLELPAGTSSSRHVA